MRLISSLRLAVAVTLVLAVATLSHPRAGWGAEGTMKWGVHVSLTPAFFDPTLMVYYAVHDALVRPLPPYEDLRLKPQ